MTLNLMTGGVNGFSRHDSFDARRRYGCDGYRRHEPILRFVQEEQFVQKCDQQSDQIAGLGRDGPLGDRPDRCRVGQQAEQPGRCRGEEPFEGAGDGRDGQIGRRPDNLEGACCVCAVNTAPRGPITFNGCKTGKTVNPVILFGKFKKIIRVVRRGVNLLVYCARSCEGEIPLHLKTSIAIRYESRDMVCSAYRLKHG